MGLPLEIDIMCLNAKYGLHGIGLCMSGLNIPVPLAPALKQENVFVFDI